MTKKQKTTNLEFGVIIFFFFVTIFFPTSCTNSIKPTNQITKTIKDTIDETAIIEFKYNKVVYDSLMKPITGIVKNKYGIIGEFVEGKRDGIHKYYFINGGVAWAAEYTLGIPNGYWQCFNESGKLIYETTFNQGTGVDITINEKGDTLYIANYKNGKLNGSLKRFYDDGELMYSCDFIDGNGIDKRYYQNRILAFEQPLVDGKENGTYKEYYENGKIKRIINFKNGLPDGAIIYWDEFGNEVSKSKYKKGHRINK